MTFACVSRRPLVLAAAVLTGVAVLAGPAAAAPLPEHAQGTVVAPPTWPYPGMNGLVKPYGDYLPLDVCAAVSIGEVRRLTGDPQMRSVPSTNPWEITGRGGCLYLGTFGRGLARVYVKAVSATSAGLSSDAFSSVALPGLRVPAGIEQTPNWSSVVAVGRRAGVEVAVGIPGQQAQRSAAVALTTKVLAYAEARAALPPPWPGLSRPAAPVPATQAATLRGVARDRCGHALPGAYAVLVRARDAYLQVSTVTSNTGEFVTPAVPAGAYDLLVMARGSDGQFVNDPRTPGPDRTRLTLTPGRRVLADVAPPYTTACPGPPPPVPPGPIPPRPTLTRVLAAAADGVPVNR